MDKQAIKDVILIMAVIAAFATVMLKCMPFLECAFEWFSDYFVRFIFGVN